MWEYHIWLGYLAANGQKRPDRTGTGTISIFDPQNLSFDLQKGFPLQTTKKMSFKIAAAELLWFLSGDTKVDTLVRQGVNIWNGDWRRIQKARGYSDKDCDWMLHLMRRGTPYEEKEIPPEPDTDSCRSNLVDSQVNLPNIYGKQWRDFEGVDQIRELLDGLKNDPYGRRHIVSAWNPARTREMALPPCHTLFQFYVHTDGKLDCKMYQRSADALLGVPYNIASYALLTHLVARHVGLTPGKLTLTFGDAHIYLSHLPQVAQMLSRIPRNLPTLKFLTDETDLFKIKLEDMALEGYDPHPAIKAPLEVGT